MIKSFRCKKTQRLFESGQTKTWTNIKKTAERKLIQLHAAESLDDLKSPPGNKLEMLSRDRQGEYSIRINKKWRICFIWTDNGPKHVEITDYH